MKGMTWDERQSVCMKKWIAGNGHGTIVASTGFGKTRVALNIIRWLQDRHPDIRVIVVVPTSTLKAQWEEGLRQHGCLMEEIQVLVINAAITDCRTCDLLVLDECHRYAADTFSRVFHTVRYHMILCLTATFERLDGRHVYISRYAPVVDSVSVQECLANGWISSYTEYAVLLDIPDLAEYGRLTREFTREFEYFGFDFGLAMSMQGKHGFSNRYSYAKAMSRTPEEIKTNLKETAVRLAALMRTIQKRKKFIHSHPEKFRITEEIIRHRPESKIITFSATVEDAKRIPGGLVYTGRQAKGRKSERVSLKTFSDMPCGILSTVRLAEEGLDLPDLDVGIVLNTNSSRTKQVQCRGRVIRYRPGKHAEFFTLLLNHTVELEWWRRAHGSDSCIYLDEDNLMKVLEHRPYKACMPPSDSFITRC